MNYQVLLFDADNTLFDFDRAEESAFRKTMEELTGEFRQEWFARYIEVNKQFWIAFDKGKISQDDLKRLRFEVFLREAELRLDPVQTNSLYLKRLSEGTFLIPEAFEIVRAIKPGRKLIFATNGLKEVQRPRFQASELTQYFDGIVISDELGAAKPKKAFFDAAFDVADNPEKSEVLMIGDSLTSDMKGGIRYGIDTCWFNPNGRENVTNLPIKYEIKSLRELLPIV